MLGGRVGAARATPWERPGTGVGGEPAAVLAVVAKRWLSLLLLVNGARRGIHMLEKRQGDDTARVAGKVAEKSLVCVSLPSRV